MENKLKALHFFRDTAWKHELNYLNSLESRQEKNSLPSKKRKVAGKEIYEIETSAKSFLLARLIFDVLIEKPELLDQDDISSEILAKARHLRVFESLSPHHPIYVEALQYVKFWLAPNVLVWTLRHHFNVILKSVQVESAHKGPLPG